MRTAGLAAAAFFLVSAAPSFAGVYIRQYQQEGVPTPYPNATGDSQTEAPPPPQTEQFVPHQVSRRNSPPIRISPY